MMTAQLKRWWSKESKRGFIDKRRLPLDSKQVILEIYAKCANSEPSGQLRTYHWIQPRLFAVLIFCSTDFQSWQIHQKWPCIISQPSLRQSDVVLRTMARSLFECAAEMMTGELKIWWSIDLNPGFIEDCPWTPQLRVILEKYVNW